jgi:putative spermidine/putrescine transport system permease protein
MQFHRRLVLLCAPALLLMAVFAIGLVLLAAQSLRAQGGWSFQNYADFFARPDFVNALLRTLWLSLLTTVISAALAYPVARTIARPGNHRTILMILVILPWMVSIVVRSYGWVVTLGNRGTANSLLQWIGAIERPVQMLFGNGAIVVGLVHVFCPFIVFALLAVMEKAEPALEEASMSLGAGPLRTFWRVNLPLIFPGLTAGCSIVFLLSVGAVLTPLLLGGPRNATLGVQIYQDIFQLFNFPRAAAATMILMAVAMAVIIPLNALERRFRKHMPSVVKA